MLDLVNLATAVFGKLTRAEQRLLLALPKGAVAVGGADQDNNSPANDPSNANTWSNERQVRAALIRWICVNDDAKKVVDPMGIQAYGMSIIGALDLSYAIVPFPLEFWHCRFMGTLDLTAGQFNELDLQGTWVQSIGAERVEVRHSVFLRNGFRADGEVRFLGGQVGGDFDCGRGIFSNPLRPNIEDTGIAINADRIIVKGVVFFNDHFEAQGEVRLIDAEIGAKLDCGSGVFKNPPQVAGAGVTLNADRATVKAGVFLSGGFVSEGEVRLLGAKIGGDLVCSGGTFKNHSPQGLTSDGDALTADGVSVASNLLLGNSYSEGNLRFLDARIGGVLTCIGGTFETLNLRRAAIKDAFFWQKIQNIERANLDLTDASVAALFDESKSWPAPGHLALNGFIYERISDGPVDADSRLDWLARQTDLKPQPFRRLAQVLKDLGDDDGARVVLVEMERRKRTGDWSSSILRFTTGYGYHPLWALWWLGGLGALGWIIFRRGQLARTMTPTDADAYKVQAASGQPPEHYPRFSPMVYSLENSLPLVKLGQVDKWQPDPNSHSSVPTEKWVAGLLNWSKSRTPASGQLRALINKCLTWIEYLSNATRSPVFLRRFYWLQVVLGWVLATLFAAGIAGLVQK